MKGTSETSLPASQRARGTRPTSPRNDQSPYVSAAQTHALLAASQQFRAARLGAGDMVSTDEAAELAGTSRVTVNSWISKGRAIGLSQIKRGFKLPKWQFEPAMWSAIPRLAASLRVREGWALLSFLESPHAGLDGRTPRAAIEQGEVERVIALAEAEGN
jgi:hypothetical protein